MDFLLPLIVGLAVGAGLGALAVLLVNTRSQAPAPEPDENPEVIRARHEAALAQQRSDSERAVAEVREQLASALWRCCW